MSKTSLKTETFKLYNYQCFLNGVVLVKKNPLTIHHIIPKRVKVINKISNYAPLCRLEHDMFNALEVYNQSWGDELNAGFMEYKKTFDINLIYQMREFVDKEIERLGYKVVDTGKILTLRR